MALPPLYLETERAEQNQFAIQKVDIPLSKYGFITCIIFQLRELIIIIFNTFPKATILL